MTVDGGGKRESVCQPAVSSVPHHGAYSGWRRAVSGARSSGQWLTRTIGPVTKRAAQRIRRPGRGTTPRPTGTGRGAAGPRRPRPRRRPVPRDRLRPRSGRAVAGKRERVVVQREQRRDRHRPVRRPRPHRKLVLRGEHAEAAAHLQQRLVPGDAAHRHRVGGQRPQLVVARRPDHPREPVGQRCRARTRRRRRPRRRRRHDQPVVRVLGPQRGGELPVLRVPDVQVADSEQPPGHQRANRRHSAIFSCHVEQGGVAEHGQPRDPFPAPART